MTRAALVLGGAIVVLIVGCGEFLPLDEDPAVNVRIAKFDPSPVAPKYDREFGIIIPSTDVYVENYSQVPVTFTRFEMRYYEARQPNAQGQYPEFLDLRQYGGMTLYVPGVPTPDPYIPDSTGTRQVKTVAVTGLQILTPAVYERASGGTHSLERTDDDVPMFAVVRFFGETDGGATAEVEGAVPITSLLQK